MKKVLSLCLAFSTFSIYAPAILAGDVNLEVFFNPIELRVLRKHPLYLEQIQSYFNELQGICGDISRIDGFVHRLSREGKFLDSRLSVQSIIDFIDRLRMMVDFLREVFLRFNGNYFLKSTGSDLHNGCKQVVYLIDKVLEDEFAKKYKELENKETKLQSRRVAFGIYGKEAEEYKEHNKNKSIKLVYKPHSLFVDDTIMYIISLFNDLTISEKEYNDFLKKNNYSPLNTASIDPKNNTIEFFERKKELTERETRNWLFHFGILSVLSYIFGFDDLHSENLFTYSKGIIGIDLEMAFMSRLPYPIIAAVIDYSSRKDENLSFSISSSNEFNLLDALRLKKYPDLFKSYTDGIILSKKVLAEKESIITEIIGKLLKNITEIRIVNLSTETLYDLCSEARSEYDRQRIDSPLFSMFDDYKKKNYNGFLDSISNLKGKELRKKFIDMIIMVVQKNPEKFMNLGTLLSDFKFNSEFYEKDFLDILNSIPVQNEYNKHECDFATSSSKLLELMMLHVDSPLNDIILFHIITSKFKKRSCGHRSITDWGDISILDKFEESIEYFMKKKSIFDNSQLIFLRENLLKQLATDIRTFNIPFSSVDIKTGYVNVGSTPVAEIRDKNGKKLEASDITKLILDVIDDNIKNIYKENSEIYKNIDKMLEGKMYSE